MGYFLLVFVGIFAYIFIKGKPAHLPDSLDGMPHSKYQGDNNYRPPLDDEEHED